MFTDFDQSHFQFEFAKKKTFHAIVVWHKKRWGSRYHSLEFGLHSHIHTTILVIR